MADDDLQKKRKSRNLVLGGIPREATLLGHLKRTFPSVRDVHLSFGGVCR